MRILIVEDDESIRETLGHVIETLGHESFLVKNEEEAAQALQMTHPDLILLDLLLNGTIATPFIAVSRDLTQEKPPRIVILSALKDANKVAEREGVEFLSKPFDLDKLEQLIGGK